MLFSDRNIPWYIRSIWCENKPLLSFLLNNGTLGISSHGESFAKRSRKSARILVLQLLLIPTANQIVLHCPKGQSALQQHRREQGG